MTEHLFPAHEVFARAMLETAHKNVQACKEWENEKFEEYRDAMIATADAHHAELYALNEWLAAATSEILEHAVSNVTEPTS